MKIVEEMRRAGVAAGCGDQTGWGEAPDSGGGSRRSPAAGVLVGDRELVAGWQEPAGGAWVLVRRAFPVGESGRGLLARMGRLVLELVAATPWAEGMPAALGLVFGRGAVVDGDRGVRWPALGWEGESVGREMEALLGVPVAVEAAHEAALAGFRALLPEPRPVHVAGIFADTDVELAWAPGGGFGRPRGRMALGHMPVHPDGPRCRCGERGCLESVAGRRAILESIADEIGRGRETVLPRWVGDLARGQGGDLQEACARNDAVVNDVLARAAGWLGVAVSNVAYLLHPEVVVLGGGVVEAMSEEHLDLLASTARARMTPSMAAEVVIVAPPIGCLTHLAGAAALAGERRGPGAAGREVRRAGGR